MFDVSAENLFREIQAAESYRDRHLTHVQSLVDYYTGSAYNGRGDAEWSENHMFEFIRLNTAKVVFDNPKVRVSSRRPATQGDVALALQHGINRNVKETDMRKLLKRVFVNQCFCWDTVLTTIEPQPHMDPRSGETYHWPTSYQIERDRWFFDPLCRYYGGARYAGHKFVMDKEDMLELADGGDGWNKAAIMAIAEDSGIEDLRERQQPGRADLRRKELVCYEIWVPEIEMRDPNDGYNGSLYTIAVAPNSSQEKDSLMIREPRAYYGPRWGPYTLYGVYPVPGNPYPLGPFMAVKQQMQQLNDVTSAAYEAIEHYKKIVIVSADNPDLQKKIKNTPDMFIIPVKGFQKDQVVEVELGGLTPQHLEQIRMGLDRMDRNSGIDEAHRGNVGSRSTATEIAVADEAAKGAISYVQQEFTDATVQMLKTRLWFMYHDDRVNFPLGAEAATELQMGEPWYEGGAGEQSEYAFDDLELEIEPFSMERMSEALGRAQYKEMMDLAIGAAGVIPQTPFYDWKLLFDKGGDVNNDPSFGEFFLSEVVKEVFGSAPQDGAAPSGSSPSGLPGGASGAIAKPGDFSGQIQGGLQRQAML